MRKQKTATHLGNWIISLTIVFVVFCFPFSSAFGQKGNIEGKVIDAKTGLPLFYANVILEGTKIGDATDEDGVYRITHVPPGKFNLKAWHVGYESEIIEIKVISGETVTFDFELTPEAIAMKSVSVEAETDLPTEGSLLRYPASRNAISIGEIRETVPTYTEEILRAVPGIYYQDETGDGTKPNIAPRGLDPRRSQRVAILADDVPIELAPYGMTGLSLFPLLTERIHQIDVLRGGVAVRHGPNTVGGVINMITTPIPTYSTANIQQTFGQNAYWSNSLSYGTRKGKLGFLGQFVSKMGDGCRENNEMKAFNYNIKLNYELSTTSLLEASFDGYNEPETRLSGSLTKAEFEEDYTQSAYPYDKFEGYRYGGNIKFSKQISATQMFHFLVYGHSADRNFWLGRSNNTQQRTSPRHYNVFAVEPRYSIILPYQKLTFGARYLIEDANWSQTQFDLDENGNPVGHETIRYDSYGDTKTYAFYIDDRIAFSDKFTLYPGVRVEKVDLKVDVKTRMDEPSDEAGEQKFTEYLPGISANFVPNSKLTFFTSYHRAFRAPQYVQIATGEGNYEKLQDFVAERSNNIELGTRIGPHSWFYGEMTLFYIDFDNQIQRDPAQENVYRNIGATEHRGVESKVVLAWNNFELNTSYTYVDAKIKSGEFDGNDVVRSPDHRIYWKLSYNAPCGLGLVFDGIHASDAFQDEENTVEENETGILGIIPAYTVMNCGVSYNIPKWNLTVFAHLKNITDEIIIHRDYRGILPGPGRVWLAGFRKELNWK